MERQYAALIVNGEVYFATVQQLNDPFEFRWREILPTDPVELDKYVRKICEVNFPKDSVPQRSYRFHELIDQLQELNNKRKGRAGPTVATVTLGVFCASEIHDDILMWSHYAANHSGVCVGIPTARMSPKVFRQVQYSNRVPILDAWEYVRRNREVFVDLSRSKADHWSYEKEWRSINKAGVRLFPGCVDRVIIGALANDETRAAVREAVVAAQHEVDVTEARLSDTHYRLDIVPPHVEKAGGAHTKSTNRRRHRSRSNRKR